MTTTTVEPPQVDTTPELTLNLDDVPTCGMGEQCVGEHGPAVARLLFHHRCDHREVVLICRPCLVVTVQHQFRFVEILCPRCQDEHVCMLCAHAELVRL